MERISLTRGGSINVNCLYFDLCTQDRRKKMK